MQQQCARHHTRAARGAPASARPAAAVPLAAARRAPARHVAAAAEGGGVNPFAQQQQQQQTVVILAPPPPGAAAASAASAADKLSPEQQQQWADCVRQLVGIGLSDADAERLVARAFGWGTQAYWRQEKVEEAPDAARTAAAIALLRELGLSDTELPRVIKAFPEALGRGADALEGNISKLRKDWKLEGQVLAKAVARQPAVLGYTMDCAGDCVGDCVRCWARF